MKVTITKVERVDYFATDEPGSTINVVATIDPPIHRSPDGPYAQPDEVTRVEFDVYSDEDHKFKPLAPGVTWLKPNGYVTTKAGARNKTHGFTRLHRDLSDEHEAEVIAHLLSDPNLPEVLRPSTQPSQAVREANDRAGDEAMNHEVLQ